MREDVSEINRDERLSAFAMTALEEQLLGEEGGVFQKELLQRFADLDARLRDRLMQEIPQHEKQHVELLLHAVASAQNVVLSFRRGF